MVGDHLFEYSLLNTLNLISSVGKLIALTPDTTAIKIFLKIFNLKNIDSEIKLLQKYASYRIYMRNIKYQYTTLNKLVR